MNSVPTKVWSCAVRKDEAEAWERKYRVANVKALQNGAELRLLSQTPPSPGAREERMTLEDAFLYYFSETGGQDK